MSARPHPKSAHVVEWVVTVDRSELREKREPCQRCKGTGSVNGARCWSCLGTLERVTRYRHVIGEDRVTVQVSIDLDALCSKAAVRAANNKSGQGILVAGLVRGRVVRREPLVDLADALAEGGQS